jgi:hypothetical protein
VNGTDVPATTLADLGPQELEARRLAGASKPSFSNGARALRRSGAALVSAGLFCSGWLMASHIGVRRGLDSLTPCGTGNLRPPTSEECSAFYSPSETAMSRSVGIELGNPTSMDFAPVTVSSATRGSASSKPVSGVLRPMPAAASPKIRPKVESAASAHVGIATTDASSSKLVSPQTAQRPPEVDSNNAIILE